jgi:hypothetical protein
MSHRRRRDNLTETEGRSERLVGSPPAPQALVRARSARRAAIGKLRNPPACCLVVIATHQPAPDGPYLALPGTSLTGTPCWRGSAGPPGGWSRPGGNGRGHWPQPSPRECRSVLWPARGWSGRFSLPTMNMLSNSGNRLLVSGCERNVNDTHRNSAADAGQLPGLPEERMPAGLVLIHGRAHGARIAAQPAEAAGARCKPPGQIPGLAAANAAAVTR